MRPIDGDALAGVIEDAAGRLIDDGYSPQGCALREAAAFIKEFPAIEAEPVRHGQWIFEDQDILKQPVRCSVCGWGCRIVNPVLWMRYPGHKFCGNCGAKMDAGGA